MDPPAPGKHQLTVTFWLHPHYCVTGEPEPEPLGQAVPQLPTHRNGNKQMFIVLESLGKEKETS